MTRAASARSYGGANPTQLNGTTVPAGGALTTGNVLQANGAASATWAPVNLAGGANYVSGALPTANQVSQVGRYIKTTVLTSGTSFTTNASTNTIVIRGVGGGGGGGGCTSVSAAASAAGGGGGGGYAEKTFAVSPNTAYSYTIGAAGTGQSGAGGTNGTGSTFVVGGTTVTATGGLGAPVATALTTLSAYAGGQGSGPTNGDINAQGQDGLPGFTLIVATPIVCAGAGGNTLFGAGGSGRVTVGNGNAPTGTGSGGGGGGAATGASTVRTGGNGGGGSWVVDEYS